MPPKVLRRMRGLADHDVPVIELTGAGSGPRLTVLAGVHGCEYRSSTLARVMHCSRDCDQPHAS